MNNIIAWIAFLTLLGCDTMKVGSGSNRFKTATITLDHYDVTDGDLVLVTGGELASAGIKVTIDDVPADYSFIDSTHGQFTYKNSKIEATTVTFANNQGVLAELPLVDKALLGGIPVTAATSDQICSDTLAKNLDGEIFKGTATCAALVDKCATDGATGCVATADYRFATTAGIAPKIASGSSVAGVTGTAETRAPNCTADGQANCIVDGTQYRSATVGYRSIDLRSGVTAGGVAGDILVTIPPCATDGQLDCSTSANFPSIDGDTIRMNASSILSGHTIAGVAGTLATCAQDGDSGCVLQGTSLVALERLTAAPKIITGQSIGGVAGTGLARPADCSADGQTGCVAVSNFPALDKTVLIGGIGSVSSTISVAGVQGALHSCLSDGQLSCVSSSSYPAIDVSRVSIYASSLQSGVTVGGVAGALTTCTGDGQLQCVSTTNFPSMLRAGAEPKILGNQTLGGVVGTATVKPSDCATDGSVNCVTVPLFPAMNASTSAAKILTGQTIASVSGTAALTPESCAADAQINCVTSAAYPASEKALLTGLASSFTSDLTLGGVTGTIATCNDDGDTDCLVLGPVLRAADTTGAAGKILLGDIAAGVTGSVDTKPPDCTADAMTSCVTNASFPAVDIAGADAKIVLGQSVAGVLGTATDYRPSDCLIDGERGCVTNTSIIAIDASTAAAKIAAGDTLGGIAGTAAARPSDCSTDGGTNCVAVTNYPSIVKSYLTAQLPTIRSTVTIAGSTGTLIDCANDGLTNCVAVSAYPAATASSVSSKVLTGNTLAGIAGSVTPRPVDCSADGASGCVATTAYPSVQVSTVTAASMRSGLTLGGVAGSLPDCALDGDTSCMVVTGFAAALKSGAAAKILAGQTVAGVTGTGVGRYADCAADGITNCTAVTAFPAASKIAVTAAKAQMRTSQTIAGITGTLANCAADAATGCVTVAGFPSMDTNLAAAKIKSGSVLGGVTGNAAAKPADCAADAATSCSTVALFPAIDSSALLGKASKIRTTKTIAGVTGTLANCSTDSGLGCVSLSTYPAMQVSGAAAKIRSGQTLGGVAGTALAPPANCTADNVTNCVGTATFPAVDATALTANASKYSGMTLAGVAGTLANCSLDGSTNCITTAANPAAQATSLTAGLIKSGVTLGGVTGAYPSATYPLPGASATADLTSSSFNAQLQSAAAFEYWTPAGVRYTGAGTTSLAAANINTTIFGITGTYYPDCSADGQTQCIATSTYKSADPSLIDPWNLNRGTTVAGVAGKLARPRSGADLTTFNLTTGTGASASTSVADAYDTIEDSIVSGTGGTTFPAMAPAVDSWFLAAVDDILVRDPAPDTNGDGVCDVGEICQFYDKNTKKTWARFDASITDWEGAITACATGATAMNALPATGWRLPMIKEMMQLYIDGFAAKSAALGVTNASHWTATTASTNTANAYSFNPNNGAGSAVDKTTTAGFLCIHD